MILIAGPSRVRHYDDTTLLALSLARLEDAAWPILNAGHIPMISQRVSLGVLAAPTHQGPTVPFAGQVAFITAERLLRRPAHRLGARVRCPGRG